MIITSNLLVKSNLKGNFERYKSIIKYSFIIGLFMGSLPFIYQSIESLRVQKLIQEQRKIQIQNKEKICKKNNSDYKKFLSLGFPKTAMEKFNICMQEQ